jgi:hypothetical protein
MTELVWLQGKFPEFARFLETPIKIIKREGRRSSENLKGTVLEAVSKRAHTLADILDETKLSRVLLLQTVNDLVEEKRLIKRKQARPGSLKGATVQLYFLPNQVRRK